MQTLTDRKLAEEQQKTYEVQQEAQKQRQQLVRETALANIQQQMVEADQGVRIAELEANASVMKANGEAEAVRAIGQAKADAYRAGAEAMGSQGYTAVQLMQIIGERGVQIVPEVLVSGGTSGGGSVAEALLGVILQQQAQGLKKDNGAEK
jgi:uncharacterized membrane protein YqiK